MILSGEGSPGTSGAGTAMENAAHAIAVVVNLRNCFKMMFFMVYVLRVKILFPIITFFQGYGK